MRLCNKHSLSFLAYCEMSRAQMAIYFVAYRNAFPAVGTSLLQLRFSDVAFRTLALPVSSRSALAPLSRFARCNTPQQPRLNSQRNAFPRRRSLTATPPATSPAGEGDYVFFRFALSRSSAFALGFSLSLPLRGLSVRRLA